MDAVSFAQAAKQAKRIKRFIEEPDSDSGLLTVPAVLSGKVTVKEGRVAILPRIDLAPDAEIDVQGEIFVPSSTGSGADMSVAMAIIFGG